LSCATASNSFASISRTCTAGFRNGRRLRQRLRDERRHKGEDVAGIRQTPNGKWQARYYDPSGRLRGKTFARKTDAQAFLAATKTDVHRAYGWTPAVPQPSLTSGRRSGWTTS
jgi:hypothetical protein